MCKHWPCNHISDSENGWNFSLEFVVDYDPSLFIKLHSDFLYYKDKENEYLRAKVLREGSSSSRNQNVIGGEFDRVTTFDGLDCDFSGSPIVFAASDFVPNQKLDALLGEDFSKLVSNVSVKEGADVVHVLNDSHLSSESAVD